jgi:hypothetical protein
VDACVASIACTSGQFNCTIKAVCTATYSPTNSLSVAGRLVFTSDPVATGVCFAGGTNETFCPGDGAAEFFASFDQSYLEPKITTTKMKHIQAVK